MMIRAIGIVVALALAGCASMREQGRTQAQGLEELCRIMMASGQVAPGSCELPNRDDRSPGGVRVGPPK